DPPRKQAACVSRFSALAEDRSWSTISTERRRACVWSVIRRLEACSVAPGRDTGEGDIMAGTSSLDPLSDPVLLAAGAQAVEPYREVLTPEAFEEMREALAGVLAMHPVTDRLARRLRERTNVTSGEQARDGGAREQEIEAKRKGA